MNGKISLSGGKPRSILTGEVTVADESGNADYLLCDGSYVDGSTYPVLGKVLPVDMDYSAGVESSSTISDSVDEMYSLSNVVFNGTGKALVHYCGKYWNLIFVSTDGGKTWPEEGTEKSIDMDGSFPTYIYFDEINSVCIMTQSEDTGVLISKNFGSSWTRRTLVTLETTTEKTSEFVQGKDGIYFIKYEVADYYVVYGHYHITSINLYKASYPYTSAKIVATYTPEEGEFFDEINILCITDKFVITRVDVSGTHDHERLFWYDFETGEWAKSSADVAAYYKYKAFEYLKKFGTYVRSYMKYDSSDASERIYTSQSLNGPWVVRYTVSNGSTAYNMLGNLSQYKNVVYSSEHMYGDLKSQVSSKNYVNIIYSIDGGITWKKISASRSSYKVGNDYKTLHVAGGAKGLCFAAEADGFANIDYIPALGVRLPDYESDAYIKSK